MRRRSVENVERVSQCPIEFRALDLVELTHRAPIERIDGHGDNGVAVDHARLGETFVRSDRDLGANTAGGSGDRCDFRRA